MLFSSIRVFHIAALLGLGGCSTIVPSFDLPKDQDGVPTVSSIVDRIECELASMLIDDTYAYRQYFSMGDFVAAFQLDLSVTDSGGLAPSFAYLDGPFSFGAGATLSQSREQNYTQLMFISMRELARDVDANPEIARCSKKYDTNLSGDLGLRTAVDLALSSRYLSNETKLSGTNGVFGGRINFVVTKSLNSVGPTWTLRHFRGPGGLASLSEVNTDKIVFAFARGPNIGKKYTLSSTEQAKSAEALIQQINLNSISTQLSNIRYSTQ